MSPDMIQVAVDRTRRALLISLELSLPVLVVGMVIGFLISLLQAVTQIQEQTLSFVPKVLAMAAALFLALPWMLTVLADYAREVISGLRSAVSP